MKNKQLLLSTLTVAMAFGTAWAVRGKFGHEQGAAWAGAIGALSVILVAKRNDWYNKVFKIALAAAFGWGLGGMISYGVVVGYGRGNDFVNVYYGLLMLFVIGALYGFLGGGLFGLALVDSKSFKVKWLTLIAEMVGWGLLVYGFLINQLEWFMTPPRSELWAACLGACIPVAWHAVRLNHAGILKVVAWSAPGAGFGFAFGNFLQVMGNVSGIAFNFWNVMEYSIGFFGGLGMAYSTLTAQWPVSEEGSTKYSDLLQVLLLFAFIPFVLWDQSFVADKMAFIIDKGGSETTILIFQIMAIGAMLIAALVVLFRRNKMRDYATVRSVFILYLGVYIFLSFLLTGIYVHPLEQYLYLANMFIVLMMLPRLKDNFIIEEANASKWIRPALLSMLAIAIMTAILISSHGEMPGAQIRFK